MPWSSRRGGNDTQIKSPPKHFLSGHVSEDLPQVRNWCWLEIVGFVWPHFRYCSPYSETFYHTSLSSLNLLACISEHLSCVIFLSTPRLNVLFIIKIAPMGFQLFFCFQIACEKLQKPPTDLLFKNIVNFS